MRVSITLLQYEHGVIRQVLDCLKEILENDSLEKHERVTVEIHGFLLEFMDGFHHTKEERFMFPAASKISEGPAELVKALVDDHVRARKLLVDMGRAIVNGSIGKKSKFTKSGRELVEHVTDHIKKEEEVAFPTFEEIVTVDEDMAIYASYERFVLSEFDEGFMRRSEDLAFKIENEVLGPGYYEGIV